MRHSARLLLLALSLTALTDAAAQKVTIYRCTAADGSVTMQNATPCPKDTKQEKRVIEPVTTVAAPPTALLSTAAPAATPAPAPPAPAAPRPSQVPVAPATTPGVIPNVAPLASTSDRLPPPALFECRTYNNDRYLSDTDTPPQRCAPTATTGISGDAPAGAACQMVSDLCQRIPDGAVCDSWKERLRQAESAVRFGAADQQAKAQVDVERVGRIVRESTCGI